MKINGKDIGDAVAFLQERDYSFTLLTKEEEKWCRETAEFMDEPSRERKLFPIGELPRRFMDSSNLRWIENNDSTFVMQSGSEYALFEGFDANTVTVGRHGDLDVRVCVDGSIVMLW